MYLDALFGAFLLYFGLAGLFRGFWSSLLGVLGFLTGYLGAWLYARPFGEWISTQSSWPGPLCYAAAGFTLLAGGSFFWKLVDWWRQSRAKKRGEDAIGGGQRAAGLVFGLVQGAAFGIVLVWGASIIPKDPRLAPLKLDESMALHFLGPMTAPFTEVASTALTGDVDTGRVLTQTLLNRDEVEKKVSELTHSPVFADLANDPGLQQAFQSGKLENLGEQPAFRRVMEAPETKNLIQTLGGGKDTQGIERGVEKLLVQGTQMAHRMRNDPRVQDLTKDPQIQALIEKRDFVSLMQHPRVAELLNGVSGAPTSLAPASPGPR